MTKNSDYDYWRARVNGEIPTGYSKKKYPEHLIKINADVPQCGFYKRKMSRDGKWIPIAFWKEDNKIVCFFQGKKVIDASDHWTFSCVNAVTEEAFRHAVKHGSWPDEFQVAPIGHNLPTEPFERLKSEIDDYLEQASVFLTAVPNAPSKEDANKARNMKSRLDQLTKQADELFKMEKQPLVEAAREIDKKFKFRETLSIWGSKLRAIYEAYLKAEDVRLRAEAQIKFEAECKAAQLVREEGEKSRKQLEEADPILAYISKQDPLPELPAGPEEIKSVQVGGGTGRRAGLKTVYVGIIEDYSAVLAYFFEDEAVIALIQKLVDKEVRKNKDKCKIPGVVVKEDKKACW